MAKDGRWFEMATITPTEELEKILHKTSMKDVQKYLRSEGINEYQSLADYFNDYLLDHDMKKSEVVQKSHLESHYVYGMLNGTKSNPDRDFILAVCFACNMKFKEVQRALKIAEKGILYAKKPRDAFLTILINKKQYDITLVNEILQENGFHGLRGTYA